ncbi:hypothetical protein BDB01DRAFT_849007 [Pilobolus umbonatus]|nr:hypothetical protein BDB01DRAFT_849007 [Pilobolus umbonatus]
MQVPFESRKRLHPDTPVEPDTPIVSDTSPFLKHTIKQYEEIMEKYDSDHNTLRKKENELTKENTFLKQELRKYLSLKESPELLKDKLKRLEDLTEENRRLQSFNTQLQLQIPQYPTIIEQNRVLHEKVDQLTQSVSELKHVECDNVEIRLVNAKLKAVQDQYFSDHTGSKPESPQDTIYKLKTEIFHLTMNQKNLEFYEKEVDEKDALIDKLENENNALKNDLEAVEWSNMKYINRVKLLEDDIAFKAHNIDILKKLLDSYAQIEDPMIISQANIDRIHQLQDLLTRMSDELKSRTEEAIRNKEQRCDTRTNKYDDTISYQTYSNKIKELHNINQKQCEEIHSLKEEIDEYKRKLKLAEDCSKAAEDLIESSKSRIQVLIKAVSDLPLPKHHPNSPSSSPQPNNVISSTDETSENGRILKKISNPEQEYLDTLTAFCDSIGAVNTRDDKGNEVYLIPAKEFRLLNMKVAELKNEAASSGQRLAALQEHFTAKADKMAALIRQFFGYHVVVRSDGAVKIESIFMDKSKSAFLMKPITKGGYVLRVMGTEKDTLMAHLQNSYRMYVTEFNAFPPFFGAFSLEMFNMNKLNYMESEDFNYQCLLQYSALKNQNRDMDSEELSDDDISDAESYLDMDVEVDRMIQEEAHMEREERRRMGEDSEDNHELITSDEDNQLESDEDMFIDPPSASEHSMHLDNKIYTIDSEHSREEPSHHSHLNEEPSYDNNELSGFFNTLAAILKTTDDTGESNLHQEYSDESNANHSQTIDPSSYDYSNHSNSSSHYLESDTEVIDHEQHNENTGNTIVDDERTNSSDENNNTEVGNSNDSEDQAERPSVLSDSPLPEESKEISRDEDLDDEALDDEDLGDEDIGDNALSDEGSNVEYDDSEDRVECIHDSGPLSHGSDIHSDEDNANILQYTNTPSDPAIYIESDNESIGDELLSGESDYSVHDHHIQNAVHSAPAHLLDFDDEYESDENSELEYDNYSEPVRSVPEVYHILDSDEE